MTGMIKCIYLSKENTKWCECFCKILSYDNEDDTHVNFRLLWLRENVLYLILQTQYLLI